MNTYLTWKEMYRLAYDHDYMDLGSQGTTAALALRRFDFLGEQHPQTRLLAYSRLERVFFAIGDEVSRVNDKLWYFQGRTNVQEQKWPLGMMAAGAMSGVVIAGAVMYTLS